jgi:hypothetical protein
MSSLSVRFWEKVRIASKDECWLWTASLNNKGYGKIGEGKKILLAHRVSWELHFGPIPDRLCVLHKCDNPKCVNPDHLFLGTQKDNAQDMVRKNRGFFQKHPEKIRRGDRHWTRAHPEKVARGDRHGSKIHPEKCPRGSRNGCSKLIEEQIKQIRKEYVPGVVSQEQLARRYGVSQVLIGKIVRRKVWRHV